MPRNERRIIYFCSGVYTSRKVKSYRNMYVGGRMEERGTRLEGKVAIVTGAGATGEAEFVGIGQAISLLFTRQGAKVILVDRDERNALITLSQIENEGGEASVFVGDVTNLESCQAMTEAAVQTYGKLNVLINNVGTVSYTHQTLPTNREV